MLHPLSPWLRLAAHFLQSRASLAPCLCWQQTGVLSVLQLWVHSSFAAEATEDEDMFFLLFLNNCYKLLCLQEMPGSQHALLFTPKDVLHQFAVS